MKAELSPYLYFDGNCREAAFYYAHVFEGEMPRFMTYKEAGMNDFEGADKRILYTEVRFDGISLKMSDNMPGAETGSGTAINLVYVADSEERVRQVIENFRLNEAVIAMEPEETFFAKVFAMLTDKFGFNWQISCPKDAA